MKAVLHRLQEDDKQTLGRFYLFDGIDCVFECVMLELPDRANEVAVSRVCSGQYNVVYRWTSQYGHHYHIQEMSGREVDGRDHILIHVGNFNHNTNGCLLPGRSFVDLNGDGLLDVTHSSDTLNTLLGIAPNGFELIIDDWML